MQGQASEVEPVASVGLVQTNTRAHAAPDRLRQLDSLRGLAAASVVAGHVLLTFPAAESPLWRQQYWQIWYTPLHLFFAGGEAVLLFFVLSGFVLSLPFYKGPVDAKAFVVKRCLRIYPAYWLAVTLALAARWSLGAGNQALGLSDWFGRIWAVPLSPNYVVQQYVLLGCFENNDLIPVVWSLVHEMRVSLLFPLLMAAMLRWKWSSIVLVGLSSFFVGHLAGFVARRVLQLDQDYTGTLIYVPVFMVGAALAQHRLSLVERWRRSSRPLRVVMLLAALMLYTYSWWMIPSSRVLHLGRIPDMFAIVAGCSILIVAALGSERFGAVLCARPLKILGELSYSTYLFHALVWVVLVRLSLSVISYHILIPVLVAITFCVSWVVYHFVELPFIGFGRRIAGWVCQARRGD